MATEAQESFRDRVLRLTKAKGMSVSRLGHEVWDPDIGGTSPDTLKVSMKTQNPRRPPLALIEAVARVLEVDPYDFPEYQLGLARQLLDEQEVGLDQAVANLNNLATKRAQERLVDASRRTKQLLAAPGAASASGSGAAASTRDGADAKREEARARGAKRRRSARSSGQ